MKNSFALTSFLILMQVSFHHQWGWHFQGLLATKGLIVFRLSNAAKRCPFPCCLPIALHLKCVIVSIEFSSSVSVGYAPADASIDVSAVSEEDAECCWDCVIGMVDVVAVGSCSLWEVDCVWAEQEVESIHDQNQWSQCQLALFESHSQPNSDLSEV